MEHYDRTVNMYIRTQTPHAFTMMHSTLRTHPSGMTAVFNGQFMIVLARMQFGRASSSNLWLQWHEMNRNIRARLFDERADMLDGFPSFCKERSQICSLSNIPLDTKPSDVLQWRSMCFLLLFFWWCSVRLLKLLSLWLSYLPRSNKLLEARRRQSSRIGP